MSSIASPTDLATRLNTTFTAGQTAQAQMLLDEASSLIRFTIGQTLTAVTADSITLEAPSGAWLDLPQRPVTNVESVLSDGVPVTDYKLIGNRLWRVGGWGRRFWYGMWLRNVPYPHTVTVVYDHGYAAGDEHLNLAKGVCCTLASQAIVQPAGNVQSEAIDDYKVVFRPNSGPLQMTADLEASLIRAYGRAAFSIRPAIRT
jgi:hypothetical protein